MCFLHHFTQFYSMQCFSFYFYFYVVSALLSMHAYYGIGVEKKITIRRSRFSKGNIELLCFPVYFTLATNQRQNGNRHISPHHSTIQIHIKYKLMFYSLAIFRSSFQLPFLTFFLFPLFCCRKAKNMRVCRA